MPFYLSELLFSCYKFLTVGGVMITQTPLEMSSLPNHHHHHPHHLHHPPHTPTVPLGKEWWGERAGREGRRKTERRKNKSESRKLLEMSLLRCEENGAKGRVKISTTKTLGREGLEKFSHSAFCSEKWRESDSFSSSAQQQPESEGCIFPLSSPWVELH